MEKSKKIPTFDQLMNPLIKALRELGGSGTTEEIYEKVVEILKLPDGVLEIVHGEKEGAQSEVSYRLAWTRTYLKKYGVLENSSRGVWALAPSAKELDRVDHREVVKKVREQSTNGTKSTPDTENNATLEQSELDKPEEVRNWREKLQETLISMEPAAFERLTQRLLRESGFIQVEVTGRSGDGGIDGKGIVRISGLLSFHVMFQCKKYQGLVTAGHLRDFRGAIQGRADKGIFVTTGTFTRDAIKEATRDGAPPIDLIDGEQLMDKLKELSLGIKTKMVELVEVDSDWFSQM